MSISRVKGAGWALNEKLTSAQQNNLDINVTYALDKRTGQTDTLDSEILVGTSGAIAFGPSSEFLLAAGSIGYVASSLTYLSGATLQLNDGSLFLCSADGYFSSAATITFDNTPLSGAVDGQLTFIDGSTLIIAGDLLFNSTSQSIYAASSNVIYLDSSVITFGSSTGVDISGQWTGSLTLKSGFALIGASGSTVTVNSLALDSDGGALVGFVSPKSITRWYQCFGDNETEVDPEGILSTFQGSGAGTGACWITVPLDDLPSACTLTKITVYFKAASGHGALPSNFSTLKLYKKDSSSTVAATQLGSTATDTAANVAAYESGMRSLAVTVSHTVDRDNYRYVATFISESGSNTVQGMKIHGAKLEFSTSYMDQY